MDNQEPQYYSETKYLGDAEITFRGERYPELPITDTTVKINDELVCSISWQDKEAFTRELNAIIDKYRI